MEEGRKIKERTMEEGKRREKEMAPEGGMRR